MVFKLLSPLINFGCSTIADPSFRIPGSNISSFMALEGSLIESTLEGTCKSLLEEYPIYPGDSTSLQLMLQKLLVPIRATSIKKASARAENKVLTKCLYNCGGYVGSHLGPVIIAIRRA